MENNHRKFEPISDTALERQIKTNSDRLFESVRRSPISVREHLPNILQTNNFDSTVLATRSIAYLEFENKSKVRNTSRRKRLEKYKRIFTSKSNNGSVFHFDNSSNSGFRNSPVTAAAPAYVVTGNSSVFFADLTVERVDLSSKPDHLYLLFVVSFDNELRRQNIWAEFDSTIRVLLAQRRPNR